MVVFRSRIFLSGPADLLVGRVVRSDQRDACAGRAQDLQKARRPIVVRGRPRLRSTRREFPLAPQRRRDIVVPAFIISEFRTAFEMGCLLFIPFLLIDMVIASVLLSAGMMMLPPVMISLPFKLIIFILVDGWGLLAKSLSLGFR